MRRSQHVSGPGVAAMPVVISEGREAVGGGSCLVEEMGPIDLSFDMENDTALIPGVVAQLLAAAERMRLFDARTSDRVSMALHEAMLNGIHHGNLELDSTLRQEDGGTYHQLAVARRRTPPYRGRRLRVRARFEPAAAVFVITDEGRGFDPARLPDPGASTSLERPSGRGLLLIRAFMDEVSFNTTGNQIILVKRRIHCAPIAAREIARTERPGP